MTSDGWYAVYEDQGVVIRGVHEDPPPTPEPTTHWVAAERLDRPELVPPDAGTDLVAAPPRLAEPCRTAEPDGDFGYDYLDGTIQPRHQD